MKNIYKNVITKNMKYIFVINLAKEATGLTEEEFRNGISLPQGGKRQGIGKQKSLHGGKGGFRIKIPFKKSGVFSKEFFFSFQGKGV